MFNKYFGAKKNRDLLLIRTWSGTLKFWIITTLIRMHQQRLRTVADNYSEYAEVECTKLWLRPFIHIQHGFLEVIVNLGVFTLSWQSYDHRAAF